MKSSKILELSSLNILSILPATLPGIKREHVIKMNPSIARLRDNLFVMVYRVFVAKDPRTKVSNDQSPDARLAFHMGSERPKTHVHPTTPWGSDWNAEYDGAGIAFLLFTHGSRATKYRSSNSVAKDFVVLQDMILPELKGVIDARLYNTGSSIVMSYDSFDDTRESRTYITKLEFAKTSEGFVCKVLKPNLLTEWNKIESMENLGVVSDGTVCYETSHTGLGGMIRLDDALYFQKSCDPWEFQKIEEILTCKSIMPSESDYFRNVATWYQDAVEFFPSTPLVSYSNEESLGVGFCTMDFWIMSELIEGKTLRTEKYLSPSRFDQTVVHEPESVPRVSMENYKNSGAAAFMEDVKTILNLPDYSDVSSWSYHNDGQLHHRHFNFLFLYTVNPQTFQLKRFSFCFYPNPPSSTISTYVMPYGVEMVEKNLVGISYSSSHTSCNLMLMDRKEIESKLLFTPTENPKLSEYAFMYTNH